MSLRPQEIEPIPEMTATIAKAAFPKGNVWIKVRDELGSIFQDAQFADLFPAKGQPAETPWRLALVVIMQFAENLPDRQAANAVRSRIDWKYALGLELTDPGFDYSVLCEFRARLLSGQAEQRLLDTVITLARERGWLNAGGKQRTDSTHVLAAIHALNRLENTGETLRHALNVLAEAAPDWLLAHMAPEWADRYGKRFENYRLPREEAERKALAATVGNDGRQLLLSVYADDAPSHLWQLSAVQILRQVWVQQFVFEDGTLRWREKNELPPALILIQSPYDAQARYSIKRDTVWTGYKVHLTETCDPEAPHLITHVQTTPGTQQDSDVTEQIHTDLAQADLLPREHFVDEGYTDAALLVESQAKYGIDLFGPVARNGSWQAVANQGFDQSVFSVDWDAKQVTCPQGKHSHKWTPIRDSWHNELIHVEFRPSDCKACASRSLCTRSKSGAREMGLRPQEQYLALQSARIRQQTAEFKEGYHTRAGIEGTLSQGIQACGMRRSRYIGEGKTHLQNTAIATSLNVMRMVSWLLDIPLAKTQKSRFSRLCAQSAAVPA
ncbi:IS1182 family transposase [Armatimonas sp.]|uniref:IS1182 family transposase n=1 Tax=Armatimonas sp. TaxID=1872638 RepID=UPI00375075E0